MPVVSNVGRHRLKILPNRLPTLDTERLRLRAMEPDDAVDLFCIYGDAETMRFASDDAFPQQATVLEMFASVQRLLADGTSIEWGIDLKSEAKLVGTCGLHSFEPGDGLAEVGCMLSREAWGKGYMTEALSAVLQYAKQELDLVALRAVIDEPNVRSVRLLRSLGFQQISATQYSRKL